VPYYVSRAGLLGASGIVLSRRPFYSSATLTRDLDCPANKAPNEAERKPKPFNTDSVVCARVAEMKKGPLASNPMPFGVSPPKRPQSALTTAKIRTY
jgi:hypothetical protein